MIKARRTRTAAHAYIYTYVWLFYRPSSHLEREEVGGGEKNGKERRRNRFKAVWRRKIGKRRRLTEKTHQSDEEAMAKSDGIKEGSPRQ